jgi:cell division protein FtsL
MMAASAAAAPTEQAVASATRSRPARRPKAQRAVARPVLWIVVLTVLLAGVVALNVAVLRLNMTLDRLGRERAQLRADTAALQSQLSSAAATGRIEGLAVKRLGYVPATPDQTTYVRLGR